MFDRLMKNVDDEDVDHGNRSIGHRLEYETFLVEPWLDHDSSAPLRSSKRYPEHHHHNESVIWCRYNSLIVALAAGRVAEIDPSWQWNGPSRERESE